MQTISVGAFADAAGISMVIDDEGLPWRSPTHLG